MHDEADLHLFDTALRDSRHLDVIMAVDRLVVLPATEEELHQTMQDLGTLRAFINDKLPVHLRDVGRAIFLEHAKVVESHFLAGKKI
ncbi:hypothetical protein [Paraburkholderia sediminicola]|uniref:hypothetical protein n=1 Tax=Paraburkholderia sediminicola TaxID=458836 RepID=UPI0038BD50C3